MKKPGEHHPPTMAQFTFPFDLPKNKPSFEDGREVVFAVGKDIMLLEP